MVTRHCLLFYEVVDNYVEKRQPYRADHLEKVRKAHQAGDLVMGGAFDEPADGALLIFRSESSARDFAINDPYVKNNLITRWYVRYWNAVNL
jgi:hypothetical protein